MHFNIFGVVIEGKANLANRGRLLVLARIHNEVFARWVVNIFLSIYFLINEEVDVWLNFSDCMNEIVNCVYAFVGFYFYEFSFGIFYDVEVEKLQSLLWFIGIEANFRLFVVDR